MSHIFFSFKKILSSSLFKRYRVGQRASPTLRFWRLSPFLRGLGYGEVFAAAETITPRWMSYKEPNYLPADYWEHIERHVADAIQKDLKTRKWGIEMGVRYFRKEDTLPPVSFKDKRLIVNLDYYIRKYDLSVSQIVDLILLGGPEAMKEHLGWLYRHWVFEVQDDFAMLYMPPVYTSDTYRSKHRIPMVEVPHEEKKIKAFWQSKDRRRAENLVRRLYKHDDTAARRLRRNYKWLILSYVRHGEMQKLLINGGLLSFFVAFLFDWRIRKMALSARRKKK